MKVLGIEVKAGVFKNSAGQEIVYNNLLLHFTQKQLEIVKDNDGKVIKWGKGYTVATVKIKNDEATLCEIFGKYVTMSEIENLVDKDVNIFYDQYGKVASIEVITPKKS